MIEGEIGILVWARISASTCRSHGKYTLKHGSVNRSIFRFGKGVLFNNIEYESVGGN